MNAKIIRNWLILIAIVGAAVALWVASGVTLPQKQEGFTTPYALLYFTKPT